MKKIILLLFLFAVLAFSRHSAAAAEEKTYVFGMRLGYSTEMDAQNKTMYTDLVNAFSSSQGIKLNLKWFGDDNAFLKAIDKGELDLFYSGQKDFFIKHIKNYDYLTIPYYLSQKANSYCIYANKESRFKDLNSLKGAELITEPDKFMYFLIRDLIDEKPENFFASFKSSPNEMSAVYSLALGSTDSIFTGEQVLRFLKVNNPGPTKKVAPVKCTEKILFPPVMAKKKLPDEFITKLKNYLSNAGKEESLKKYRPLMKAYKVGFSPVAAGDYDSIIALYGKGVKNGWDKDYEVWLKTVKREGK
ncbi:MAG: PhnD/SsuA/transferrin family substrate-binding protein [bacterium]